MAEYQLWSSEKKTAEKAVTISDGSQTLYFKSFTKCADFISELSDFKASRIKNLLRDRATTICGFKIFYETER